MCLEKEKKLVERTPSLGKSKAQKLEARFGSWPQLV